MKASSIIMFILMPFTALLLLWIFFRKRYYWEHLILSVHTHTIYFLILTVVLVLDLALPAGLPAWATPILLLVLATYLLLSLRRVYVRSWAATTFRMLVMSLPYLIVFILLLGAGALWGFLSL